MEYIRPIDFDAIERSGPGERFVQTLLDISSGAKNCMVQLIKTPAGGGSPEGLHIHKVDQVFYILEGTMTVEIEGKRSDVGAGNMIFFPAGVPHQNWNRSGQRTLHIAFNTPMPDPNQPFVISVGT